jgi:hypothetical protein
MKVKFKYGIKSYSGKLDSMVYGNYRHDNLCLGRRFVYPTLNENNHSVGSIAQNLAAVYHAADENYITDLRTYCLRNGQENTPADSIVPTAFPMFVKMMYAWQASDPQHVDLGTVTLADIVTLDANVRTLARAVAAGYLPYISFSTDLTAGIQ